MRNISTITEEQAQTAEQQTTQQTAEQSGTQQAPTAQQPTEQTPGAPTPLNWDFVQPGSVIYYGSADGVGAFRVTAIDEQGVTLESLQEGGGTLTVGNNDRAGFFASANDAMAQMEQEQQLSAPQQQLTEQQTSAQPAVSQGDKLSRIPLDQNGEPDFEQAPALDTWNALVEMNDGNIAEASDTASIMAQNYRDELAKVERQRPKGKTPMEIQRQKQQKAQEIARLQSLIGYWEEVASQQAQQQAAEQAEFDLQIEENARTQQRAEARAENNPAPRNFARVYEGWQLPTSFREYLLRAISSRRLRFKWNDLNNRTRGLGAHLGLNQSEKERRKRLWLIDEKDGLTPEQAAEYAMTDFQSETGMPLHIDTMDALNEILDILASYDNSIDMYREAKRLYDFAQNPEAQAEEWYARQYGMSPEECALNDEAWEIFIAEREMSEEEYQNYINFVNESQVIEDEQRQTETIADGTSSTHEQQPTNTAGERSDTILPTEQSDNSAGDSIAQGQPETIDGESSVKDGSAHATQSRDAQLATEAVLTALQNSGIEVIEATDAMAEAVIGDNVELSAKKKRALETVSVQETEHQQTAISSADGAKVLNNLDNLAEEYDKNPKTEEKTFIGVVANALGIDAQGKSSKYATFEAKNGKIVTIRLSNHNAKVSNFDNNEETEGISIVVSAKGNNGIIIDGDAHIVEHYYDAIKLRKAEGKPLAEVVRSIKQALYSGEFTDTTGLAERQEVNLKNPELQIFGGNSGYVGYSMSRRAAEAREEGRYPKTDFMKNYRITQSSLDALVEIGVIDNTEWHHTSMYGNRTTFYGWEKPWYADAYTEKKKEIDKLAKEKQLNAEAILNLFEDTKAKDVYENTLRVEQAEKEIFSAYSDAAQAHSQANLPDEYTASNGVVIVTNGSLSSVGWEGFYNGNKAWKSWYKKAKNELFDKLNESSQSFPSFEQWRTENQDFIGQTYAKHNATPLEFLRTPQGTVYGWTDGKRVYLTKAGMNPETPIHEYTHLWARAMMQRNAEGWQSVKDLLRDTPIWQEVINDPNYQSIANDEDAIASEALSRLSGRQGAQKMQEMSNRLINEGNPNAQTLIDRMRQALQEFWNWVGTNLFGIKSFDSIDQITDRVLWDMLNGTDLGILNSGNVEFMGSRVEKRRAKIAEHFNGQQLSGNSQAIVNAFANGSKNEAIEVNGNRIALKQGNENNAGVSHSLMRHYGTSTGNYSADELLLIPQVIEQGVVSKNGNKISYKLERDGMTYTVTTEMNNSLEHFTNFYTNRKPTVAAGKTLTNSTGQTQQSVSADKDSNTSSDTQEYGELFRPTDGFSYIRGNKNARQTDYAFTSNYFYVYENLPDNDFSIKLALPIVGNEVKINDIFNQIGLITDGSNRFRSGSRGYTEREARNSRLNNNDSPNVAEERGSDGGNGLLGGTELAYGRRKIAESDSPASRASTGEANNATGEGGLTHQSLTDVATATAQRLGVVVEIDRSMSAKGAYNPRTGRIRINPDAHLTEADVERTILHEVIGHGGLQAVAGKRFSDICRQVYDLMTDEQRQDFRHRHGDLSNEALGAEFMAEMAESGDVETSTWEKIKGFIRNMMRQLGFTMSLTDADIRYMLYSASQKAKKGTLQGAIDRATTLMRLRNEAIQDPFEDIMSQPLFRPAPEFLTQGFAGLTDTELLTEKEIDEMGKQLATNIPAMLIKLD